jgi:hypothetical protein
MGDRMGDRDRDRGYGPPDRGHDRERPPYEHRPPQPPPDEPGESDDME